jgi:hypothetical protein
MPVENPVVNVTEEPRMVVVAEQEPVAPAAHNTAPAGEREGFGPERKSEAA